MNWRMRAACRAVDAEIFFPAARSGRLAETAARPARRVCVECPVRRPCLRWALHHEVMGIWGGTTERERRAMREATGASGSRASFSVAAGSAE